MNADGILNGSYQFKLVVVGGTSSDANTNVNGFGYVRHQWIS